MNPKILNSNNPSRMCHLPYILAWAFLPLWFIYKHSCVTSPPQQRSSPLSVAWSGLVFMLLHNKFSSTLQILIRIHTPLRQSMDAKEINTENQSLTAAKESRDTFRGITTYVFTDNYEGVIWYLQGCNHLSSLTAKRGSYDTYGGIITNVFTASYKGVTWHI